MMTFSANGDVAERQLAAVLWYLTALGYVDGNFDASERAFVSRYADSLAAGRVDPAPRGAPSWSAFVRAELASIEHEVEEALSEPTADGERSEVYALSRLKLRCFELFRGFDGETRTALLRAAEALFLADGVVAPEEARFHSEMTALIEVPTEIGDADLEVVAEGSLLIEPTRHVMPASVDHPLFRRGEHDYAADAQTFRAQASADVELLHRAIAKLDEKRARGCGKLALGTTFSDFASDAPFLDGHVVVHPPGDKACELLVLGDLHGCYSCLKAALLQANFFEKVQRYHDDPKTHPNMLLVLLGDYIDRGRYSYSGVLRAVLELFVAAPDHVIPLRGNHEYYVAINGQVYGAVKPSEAMQSLKSRADNAHFAEYMRLFESLPHSLAFADLFCVHGGLPREETLEQKWRDLTSLNDWDVRFQMLWSDPVAADVVPGELQKQSARFGFGRSQFRRFMRRIGCTTMIRGHERVKEGFREVYADPDARLLSLFSAGGATNDDLPADSNYREVTPMALTVKHVAGVTQVIPFVIDYERYNDPQLNGFFR